MSAGQASTNTLQVKRTFAAPREQVFRAWTDANELKRWFGVSDEYDVKVTELELRAGGRYRIEMHHIRGNVHIVTGTYRQIVPPGRLVFTWQWESRPDSPESLVTVEFAGHGGSTEVTITHELLTDEMDRARHNQGWIGCLDRYARVYGQ